MYSAPARRLTARVVALAATTLLGTACVFESPYYGQVFATTTTQVPLQTWTTDATRPIAIECAEAYHGGLYPPFGTTVWLPVVTLTPSSNASFDTKGTAIYSAGAKMVLPDACWHRDDVYTPSRYLTALRATQATASGGSTVYRVFDLAGLECMGRENGKAGNWVAWLSKNCAKTYSGSSTVLPFLIISADALGT